MKFLLLLFLFAACVKDKPALSNEEIRYNFNMKARYALILKFNYEYGSDSFAYYDCEFHRYRDSAKKYDLLYQREYLNNLKYMLSK